MTDLAHPPALAAPPPAPASSRHGLGAQLRRLRQGRALRVEDAAAHLGVKPSTISRIETGKAPVRLIYLAALLDLYGITDPAQRAALAGMARDGQRQHWWAV